MKSYIVSLKDVGMRADIFIANQLPEFSRAALSKLFDTGEILVNGHHVKHGHKLKSGDEIQIHTALLDAKPPKIKLPIIFQNEDVLVINKPAGMLSHSKGSFNSEATVASFIKSHTSGFDPNNNRAGIVHRLDRATSGVMIAAKTPEAASWLQKQFSNRSTKKVYIALVKGAPEPPEAIIDMPVGRNHKKPQTFMATSSGKPAQTDYKVLKVGNNSSLLELRPVTGRTHQLRVHLSTIGYPIIGDELYGGIGAKRLMLHAKTLELTLPSKQRRVFEAAVPKNFKAS